MTTSDGHITIAYTGTVPAEILDILDAEDDQVLELRPLVISARDPARTVNRLLAFLGDPSMRVARIEVTGRPIYPGRGVLASS